MSGCPNQSPALTRFLRRLLLAGLLSPAVFAAEDSSYRDSLLFGVFPHMPATRLFQVFSPIADDFSRQLGRPVKLRSKSDFSDFEAELLSSSYDVALIQPLDYIWLHEKNGYLPLARRNTPLRTVIIVLKGSKLDRLEELRGKTLALASKRAAVTQIGDAALVAAGFDLDEDINRSFSRNHFACMQKVLTGQADACVTARRALAHWDDVKMADRFEVIYEAPPMPHALFVVHPRVSEKDRLILKKTILSWPDTEAGKRILSRGNLLPFVEAVDSDYDPVRHFTLQAPDPNHIQRH